MQKTVESLFSIVIGACGVMAITGSVVYFLSGNYLTSSACAVLAAACQHMHWGRMRCTKSTA